jgi:hypothetical protein
MADFLFGGILLQKKGAVHKEFTGSISFLPKMGSRRRNGD